MGRYEGRLGMIERIMADVRLSMKDGFEQMKNRQLCLNSIELAFNSLISIVRQAILSAPVSCDLAKRDLMMHLPFKLEDWQQGFDARLRRFSTGHPLAPMFEAEIELAQELMTLQDQVNGLPIKSRDTDAIMQRIQALSERKHG